METVNYIKHLNTVFSAFAKDNRLNPTHISLYLALFQLWNSARFPDEFIIIRDELMSLSKIGSKSTYHKCLKELEFFGYINYMPSHNPFKGSKISLTKIRTSNEQAVYPLCTKNGTSNGQALVPLYKHDKHIKTNKHEEFRSFEKKSDFSGQEKSKGTDNLKTRNNKNYNQPL